MKYIESLIKEAPIANKYIQSLDSSWRDTVSVLKQKQLVVNTDKLVIVEPDRVKVLLIDAPLIIDRVYYNSRLYCIKERFQI